MRPVAPSIQAAARVAEEIGRAADLQAALAVVISAVLRMTGASAAVFEKREGAWHLEAGTAQARHVRNWQPLDGLDSGRFVLLDRAQEAETWTALSLGEAPDRPIALLIAGDWTASTDLLPWALIVANALGIGLQRDARRDERRLLRRVYQTVRTIGRPGSVEDVAQSVARRVARSMEADRVAVALYEPTDDALQVAATLGYPLSTVRQERIPPGAWAIGHVYSSGRPLLVQDVNRIRGMAREGRSYRTRSFVAVPMAAGSQVVGVLTITDKHDSRAFTRRDLLMARTLGAGAATAFVAARARADASRLVYEARIDSLTGLHNRYYLDERLRQEIARATRVGDSLAVLMGDIDDFKMINDTSGHQTGDLVLRMVGDIIRSTVRIFDVCARYGGDEFAILMPGGDQTSALASAERIRRRISEYRGRDGGGSRLPLLTMSLGVAVVVAGDAAADLLARVDRALYQAKAAGKNLVRIHPTARELQTGASPEREGPFECPPLG
ncbi:MAG: sensor domain-containing diguanylate cyclase [Acidobacteria bacterium]|nr:sensor domain-containing diguanylate cyclase [Acidobacteriota bacterium]